MNFEYLFYLTSVVRKECTDLEVSDLVFACLSRLRRSNSSFALTRFVEISQIDGEMLFDDNVRAMVQNKLDFFWNAQVSSVENTRFHSMYRNRSIEGKEVRLQMKAARVQKAKDKRLGNAYKLRDKAIAAINEIASEIPDEKIRSRVLLFADNVNEFTVMHTGLHPIIW